MPCSGSGRPLAACLLVALLFSFATLSCAVDDGGATSDMLEAAALGGGNDGGGVLADRYSFVSLVTSTDGPLCAGTLVAPRAVLTTAACASGLLSAGLKPQLVTVGAFNFYLDAFRRPGKYEVQKVQQVRLHPGWTLQDARTNNLALLQLAQPSTKAPVPLAAATFAYPTALSNATVFGYGSRGSDGVWPQLHADQLTLLPDAQCRGLRAAYGPVPATQSQACTALSRVFRACSKGNLGGPLLLPGPTGGAVLAGLLTDGFACSDDPYVTSPNSPGLYEWLPQHAAWLQQQLAALA
ncbi:serine endopeptidase [Chlorella sorokiniana]|uniref:Serine endopeptidase n=1 Tax=Chlorella sorokiniana TaxID=3076 RepID=A0A2P6TWC0_CHLSO|nr:serine endopeptidase [Chlorella sorokiniana]|eukprot:PRW58360.1 serine endopeptidase [Chlorella sorokiniana]